MQRQFLAPSSFFLCWEKVVVLTSRPSHRCLTCRKRKTRCDGERPTCATCEKNGHNCLGYNDLVEKPKQEPAVKVERRGTMDPSNEAEEGYLDDGEDEEGENRHWKAQSAGGGKQSHAATGSSTKPSSESLSSTSATRPLGIQSHDWEQDSPHTQQQRPGNLIKRPSYQRNVSFSEDSRSPHNRSPVQHHHERHRVPYFRYFGPTAIVPGYKQMVVNVAVRDRRRSMAGSISTTSPGSNVSHVTPSHASLNEAVHEAIEDMPVYDPNDQAPVHHVIISLIKTFFLHLGCNYPFLRKDKILRQVREKRLESILVDAMCGLAARFSELPIFTASADVSRSEYGNAFAQRAKAAIVDTFPCPTVGAVQAYILMAYESFGANQDSALWMYLGLAIRMAIDLGLQKNEGVQYQGDKDPWYTRTWNRKDGYGNDEDNTQDADGDQLSQEEQRDIVQERIDTIWAVFILDRVISTGTGRPVTIRDDEFELSLPELTVDPVSGWPAPMPALIKIIQLYGRASDVLNKISKPEDLTQEKMAKLAKVENDLTRLYQKQDPRLHFNAHNFQEYVKTGQGTTFILLHFWFHALIIILHQPLLIPGSISQTHQLLPHSRELSMSSAKTITDILAFAELIDPKSFIGNPFTSQPMYIAACAFLMESVANTSQPTSRDGTPPVGNSGTNPSRSQHGKSGPDGEVKTSKHSLLASAANQNYQRCYKSLQQLQTYWGGVNYIRVALEHRSKGIWDCETYTAEEYESTKLSRRAASLSRIPRLDIPASPNMPPIAWSLTGTTNSPNSSLTLLYQNMNASTPQPTHNIPPPAPPTPPGNMIYDPIRQSLPESTAMYPPAFPQANISAVRYSAHHAKTNRGGSSSSMNSHIQGKSMLKYETLHSDDSDPNTSGLSSMAGGHSILPPLQTHAYTSSPHTSNYEPSIIQGASPSSTLGDQTSSQQQQHLNNNNNNNSDNTNLTGGYLNDFPQSGLASGSYGYFGHNGPITDITFDSQDIDIGALGLPNDMIPPWLEYLPGDVLGLFDLNMGTGQGNMG